MLARRTLVDESRLVQQVAATVYIFLLVILVAAMLVKLVISFFPSLGW